MSETFHLPPDPRGRKRPAPAERLAAEPHAFSLDQAARVVAPAGDLSSITFRTVTRLGFPSTEVALTPGSKTELVTPLFGLVGVAGALPRHYTALVDGENRRRSTALHSFLDMLTGRFAGHFVRAGERYRPARDPRLVETVLTSLVGLGTPHLVPALQTPLAAALYHAGALASRTRSTERLRGMLSEETGRAVEIVEFAGGWIRLPEAEMSSLPRATSRASRGRLGIDIAIGSQIWDPSARFLVRIGPLKWMEFEALLPGKPLHARLVELIRLHVGLEIDFAINPVLAKDEVPPLRMAADSGVRLGWTSWSTSGRKRNQDAGDALLAPSVPSN